MRTYVQSGNAVFETKLPRARLARAIETALAAHMGRPIATTLRTAAELAAVIADNPLPEHVTSPARLCVTFLERRPTATEVAPLARTWAPEACHIRGAHIYTWHPDGQGRSPLAAVIGKLRLGGAVTTRNWNTVVKLVEMLSDP